MKKTLPYFFLILVISSMIIVIFKNDIKSRSKIITIDTLHSYLYTKDQMIEIPLYVTKDNNVFSYIESYDNTYITDNNNKKLLLELTKITYSHQEVYLKDEYIKYILKFKMPNLTSDFSIKEAYLVIDLINNKSFTFKIGEFHLKYLEFNSDVSWLNLEFKSIFDSNKCSMDTINIELDSKILDIEELNIANDYDLTYVLHDNHLIININEDNLCINYVPIWIYHDDKVLTINNYHYIIDYNILEKAGKLVNIYAFD